MGFLQRLFGIEKPQQQQPANQPVNTASDFAAETNVAQSAVAESSIPPERVGLNGEYDQSGLAKRVALAFDQNPDVADLDTVYVAQRGNAVVLKGKVPSQSTLQRLISIAKGVNGAASVETDQVAIG